MPAHCQVELDIFSGMPNPTWTLTSDETHSYLGRVAELPRTSARGLSGNLGYRGFIVQCTQDFDTQLIRIQNGTVFVSDEASNVFYADENRELERWLLNTGRPHLTDELFRIAEHEIR